VIVGESFEGLKVWQKAHELMLFVHQEIALLLPKDEKWDLADQIRRSSKSVGANIAEGYGRFYYKDRVRFCYNARGS
jgi:four helix bundle protein